MKDVVIIFITGEVLAPLRFLVLIDQPQKVKDELLYNLNLITRAKTNEVNTVTVQMVCVYVCVWVLTILRSSRVRSSSQTFKFRIT